MSLWSLLCALVCSHVRTGSVRSQTVPTKSGGWNCLNCLCVLKHEGFLWLELRGRAPPPSRLTLHLAHCSQKSCCPGNGQTPTERHDMSPRSVSTALKSSGGVLYINKRGALHCTCWCKARRELVAMETHSIKRCPCANPKPTQSPSHGTTPSSLSSWERLVLSSRFAGFDLLHLWSWKWLGHLDSVIWMAEWIPVATYTWFKVQEHLKCCSFTGLQHPSVSAATATK